MNFGKDVNLGLDVKNEMDKLDRKLFNMEVGNKTAQGNLYMDPNRKHNIVRSQFKF